MPFLHSQEVRKPLSDLYRYCCQSIERRKTWKKSRNITFNDAVEIHGIRLYERDGELKVAYPYEKRDDTYQNLAGPATLFAKGFIEEDIKEAYEKKVKKVGEQTQVPVEIPPEMLEGTPFEERSR